MSECLPTKQRRTRVQVCEDSWAYYIDARNNDLSRSWFPPCAAPPPPCHGGAAALSSILPFLPLAPAGAFRAGPRATSRHAKESAAWPG